MESDVNTNQGAMSRDLKSRGAENIVNARVHHNYPASSHLNTVLLFYFAKLVQKEGLILWKYLSINLSIFTVLIGKWIKYINGDQWEDMKPLHCWPWVSI